MLNMATLVLYQTDAKLIFQWQVQWVEADRVLVKPRPQVSALADDGRFRPLIDTASLHAVLPPLFDGYLALGAKVCGAPATDHDFGTTDFLVLLDVHELDQRTYQSLFG